MERAVVQKVRETDEGRRDRYGKRMQGLCGEMVEGSDRTSARRSRHMGMWTTPTKIRHCSDIIQVAAEEGCKVAIMSDDIEMAPEEVPSQTPPGKEKEVIATVVAEEKDALAREVLQELKKLKMKMTEVEATIKTNKKQLDSALKTNRVFSLRFFVDYILSIYKVAGGKTVFSETVERQLVVKHAVEGFNEILPLNEDIKSKLKKLENLFSKALGGRCNAGTLREAAIAIVEIAKEPKLWEAIIDEGGLATCQLMFLEVFGATVEEASTSEDLKYNKMIVLEKLRAK